MLGVCPWIQSEAHSASFGGQPEILLHFCSETAAARHINQIRFHERVQVDFCTPPDGKSVVFSSTAAGGYAQLYLRQH
jgi:hypothetical protein